MPSARQQRIAAIPKIAEQRGWEQIHPDAFDALCAVFPKTSAQTLRKDLRETGLRLHPLVEGVRLDSLGHLRRTLLALESCYSQQPAAARSAVLDARRKAEFVLRNQRVTEVLRAEMAEKHLWLRIWLDNPPLFPAWQALRSETLVNLDGPSVHP